MDIQWRKVFQSTSYHRVMVVKGMLEEHSIPVHILNKQDSVHIHLNNFIFIELFVPDDKVLKAIQLVKKTND